MTIEFIGFASTQEYSESAGVADGDPVDPAYLTAVATAHERSGFDRVLIAHSSASPDGFVIADQVLSRTSTLKVLLAHRPGFLAPTLAARSYATLDAFHPGRVALHVITGGDDADQQRDGDFADKTTRYARTDDFLSVVRQEWESATPFDHDGEFYQVRQAWSSVRPATPIPVYFGGASADAIRVGGKHADVYAFWGEPLAGIAERIREVRAAAAPYGRYPRFSVSTRPIVADTEEAAWAKAEEILERTKERAGGQAPRVQEPRPHPAGGFEAPARGRRPGRRARQAVVDRGRQGDRRRGQLHGAGRQLRAGRRRAARLRRPRRRARC